jgi:hypothetical protein
MMIKGNDRRGERRKKRRRGTERRLLRSEQTRLEFCLQEERATSFNAYMRSAGWEGGSSRHVLPASAELSLGEDMDMESWIRIWVKGV